jgi:hypothetical protein
MDQACCCAPQAIAAAHQALRHLASRSLLPTLLAIVSPVGLQLKLQLNLQFGLPPLLQLGMQLGLQFGFQFITRWH